MKIYLSYKERVAGLFILFAVLGIAVFTVAVAIENKWFEPRIPYHTHVVRGDGLRTGSPVLLSGLNVGEIGELKIMEDDRIDVEILILERYKNRMRRGITAEIKRLFGIGEKRIQLKSPKVKGNVLEAGTTILSEEPVDLMDAITNINLDLYMKTMDRAVSALEIVLTKMEENNRLERMMIAFDELGPVLKNISAMLEDLRVPLTELFQDPAVRGTFKGASRLFNNKNTLKAMKAMAVTFSPERMSPLIDKTDSMIESLDKMLAPDGNLTTVLGRAESFFSEERVKKISSAIDSLSDSGKIERLLDNMSTLVSQLAIISPELPTMSREIIKTLKEAVIVLKAMQKSWLLDDETEDVIEEMNKKKKK